MARPGRTKTREELKLYMRDRRANIRRARDVLMVQIHSGLKATIEPGPDGRPGIKMTTQFNEQQWAAITELAEAEHADPEEMIEDMLHQLMLAWRRERDVRKGSK